jgi:hypothetical protein
MLQLVTVRYCTMMNETDGTSGPVSWHMQAETVMIVGQHTSKAAVISTVRHVSDVVQMLHHESPANEDVAADQPAHNNNSKTRSARSRSDWRASPQGTSSQRGTHHASVHTICQHNAMDGAC